MTAIRGYRNLTEDEISQINDIKSLGERFGVIIDVMSQTTNEFDKRWLAIAKTHLQEGVMALVRSIARPTNF